VWAPGAAGLLLVLLAVLVIAGSAQQCPIPAAAGSGAGRFEETVYGPPWGGIEGQGVTAYGINLTAGQPMLEIAIDPSVLTPLAYYHVWPNPFDTHGAFLAGDTGGQIRGLHIDTYDWQGPASMDAWGVRYGVSVTKAADPGAAQAAGQIQAPASAPTQVEARCAQPAGFTAGGYRNPFGAAQSLAPGRIDMGVDYTGTGPIDAIGPGQVTLARAFDPGWSDGGAPFSCAGGHAGALVYRLSSGPDRGRYIYTAEGIIPTLAAGQPVHAGEQIATFTGCIETGWGSGAGDQPMAAALGQQCAAGDAGCHSTACGQNISQLIGALGGPAGLAQGPIFGQGC
jgi:3D (Asp-Asp-Asp) domain-containing protein